MAYNRVNAMQATLDENEKLEFELLKRRHKVLVDAILEFMSTTGHAAIRLKEIMEENEVSLLTQKGV